MFFSKPGEYKPAGMFSIQHFSLLAITLTIICIAFHYTKNSDKDKVKKIIRRMTIFLWILEIIKIAFNYLIGNWNNPNNYIPLYYCSIILYAGILSGWGKGILKKVGDIFIATGGIVGGVLFLAYPNTSLMTYPIFHYISIQSFIFHGTMLYLGLLVNETKYVTVKLTDISYYAILILIVSIISYFVNKKLGTNFMFISNNFPNTPVEIIYKLTGKLFTPFMIIIQATLPFYSIYFLINKVTNKPCY